MNQMQQYHDAMTDCLENGTRQANRTGIDTFTVDGRMIKYDTRTSTPAITTKKLAVRAVIGELIGFFRGYTSAADFRALGCKVWDDNANKTLSWLKSPFRKGEDDLNRVYGKQWTDWQDTKLVPVEEEHLLPAYKDLGYAVKGDCTGPDGHRLGTVIHRSINQLENALRDLITNPTSRRIIMTGWNPGENDQIALVSCHYSYQLLANVEANELNLCLSIRSNDMFLGHAFNALSAAVFLSIMARLSGFNPGTVTVFIGDQHVYVNHEDQVREQVSREHFPEPKLVISDRVKQITRLEDIAGAFTRIEPEDIWLEGYKCHPPIKAGMAA